MNINLGFCSIEGSIRAFVHFLALGVVLTLFAITLALVLVNGLGCGVERQKFEKYPEIVTRVGVK